MLATPLPSLKSRSERTAPRIENSLLYRISLEVSRRCNLACVYCYSQAGVDVAPVMEPAEVRGIIDQAVALGARLVSFVWGGEPLVWPGLFEPDVCPLLHANARGCYAYLYSNCACIGPTKAARLAALDVSVIGKCNSLRPEIQDRLAGVPGAHAAIRRGLDALMNAGLATPGSSRLGVETIVSPLNYEEIPDLWRYFRSHHMIPEVEIPTPHGRASKHADLLSFPPAEAREKYRVLFEELARIDREEFGFEPWDPRPPFPAGTCQLIDRDRNCYITHTGSVQPCAGVERCFGQLAVGPHREDGLPLEAIISSPEFQKLRRLREHIAEPCRSCERIHDCYGCRGAAFHACGDLYGPDPFCWHHPS